MKNWIPIIAFVFCLPAAECCGQSDFDLRLKVVSSLLDSLATKTPALNDRVTLDVSGAPITEFVALIAEGKRLNVTVQPIITAHISNRFSNASVKDILLFLCKVHQLDLECVNDIIYLKNFVVPPKRVVPFKEKKLSIVYDSISNLLSVDLKNDSVSLFARQLTQISGKNVLVNNDSKDRRIDAYLDRMPFANALTLISEVNNLSLRQTEDAFFIGIRVKDPESSSKTRTNGPVRNAIQEKGEINVQVMQKADDPLLTIFARQASIVEIVHEIGSKISLNYFFFTLPDHAVTVQLENMTFKQILAHLLEPTDHTFKVTDSVYLIGSRNVEGLRTSEIAKLKFRSVEGIDLVIPPDMKKDVQVSIFKELNAVILSGSAPQIDEIKRFLRAIDEPVPNILIEVIVVDVQKGFNIETGLSAILTDSLQKPTTSGSVLPGVDLTLGTNLLADLFNRTNLVNLGQVTPRFYVTLKALENNNNINIRSTPKLSTLNGHEAVLNIGQSAYFVQRTQVVTPGVTPITTITEQFHPTEANLTITINPIVSGNEHVTLKINAEFSNFVPAAIEGAPPGNATRQFNSMIRVRNGEMIVLGGLEEVSKSQTSSGIPLLSRIPILKWIFSSRKKEKSDNRLMVFIKPVIVI